MAGALDIVFVVCHPDDESLWAGGMLHGLSGMADVRTWVVCVSGADPDSPRAAEFAAAIAIAGADGGIVLGKPLRKANERLPDVAATAREGLERLGVGHVDLLVTHSPYGDEHLNPHHVQAYEQLKAWTGTAGIPFAWFSAILLPWLLHQPLLSGLHRHAGAFHLLSLARCLPAPALAPRLRDRDKRARLRPPRYHVQFDGDRTVKRKMLESYASIDLQAHEDGYAMWTTAVESLYLMDRRGLAVAQRIAAAMPTPGPDDLLREL